MPRRIQELTKAQIGRIRANLSRKATQVGDRLSKFALGESDSYGNEIEMSQAQVAAAKAVLNHVLPAQQQTQLEDITKDYGDPAEVKAQFDEAVRESTLRQLIDTGMTIEEAKEVLDGKKVIPIDQKTGS